MPSKGWAEMIRKVSEVDPMVCPWCAAKMKIIAFLTYYPVPDRVINHLQLTFVADSPPPPQIAYQKVLLAARWLNTYYDLACEESKSLVCFRYFRASRQVFDLQ